MPARKPYTSDVSDEEWALVAPDLTFLPEDAGQREYPLCEVFNGQRYLVRYGVAWRAMPKDLPPWHAVYDQARRWLRIGCFEMLAQDLRAVLRVAQGRPEESSAAALTAAPCDPRLKAAEERPGTGSNALGAPSCASPSARSVTCSRNGGARVSVFDAWSRRQAGEFAW